MLCCVVLYGAVFCCVVLCCVALCCVVLRCVVLCCIVLCCVALCCIVLSCVALCCVVLCCAVLCCIVLYCVVLCCAVLFVSFYFIFPNVISLISPSRTQQCWLAVQPGIISLCPFTLHPHPSLLLITTCSSTFTSQHS